MTVDLYETTHPDVRGAGIKFDSLVGIDDVKNNLIDELHLLLRPNDIVAWQEQHHADSPQIVSRFARRCPMVLLTGDVGCGKSVLARTVATPLAQQLDTRLKVIESPSDLRGGGHVGELSSRITELFRKTRIMLEKTLGILVIDEADDIAATRAQDQAHHEDRAGVNVLIKQLDELSSSKGLAVILISNRLCALDPAVIRRAALHLHFERPTGHSRETVVHSVFPHLSAAAAKRIATVCETNGVPFSPSDIVERLFGVSVRRAWKENRPANEEIILSIAKTLKATPLIEDPQ